MVAPSQEHNSSFLKEEELAEQSCLIHGGQEAEQENSRREEGERD